MCICYIIAHLNVDAKLSPEIHASYLEFIKVSNEKINDQAQVVRNICKSFPRTISGFKLS